MNTKVLGLLLLLAVPLAAFAQDEEEVVTASADKTLFIDAVSQSDIYELESSRIAILKAEDPAVKEFAQALIDAHTRSTVELLPLATDLSVSPTSDSSPAQSILVAYLNTLEGAAFDGAYLEQQIGAHEEAVTLFTLSSAGVEDEALEAFLDRTLPVLSEHLGTAQGLLQAAE